MTHMIDTEAVAVTPIPVMIVQDHVTELEIDAAPDFSAFATYQLTGIEGPILILPQAKKRSEAKLRVTSLTAVATAYVLIGSQAQIASRSGGDPAAQGYRLYHGQTLNVDGIPAVYAIWDGTNPVVLTVLDEKYR